MTRTLIHCEREMVINESFALSSTINWEETYRRMNSSLRRMMEQTEVSFFGTPPGTASWMPDITKRPALPPQAPLFAKPLAPTSQKLPTYQTSEERLAAFYARADAAITGREE